MAQQTVSIKLPTAGGDALHTSLADTGYSFASVAHAHWQARGECTITYYKSGKLVVQGKHVDAWVLSAEELGGKVTKWAGKSTDVPPQKASATSTLDAPTGTRFDSAIAKLPSPTPDAWIGIDETGKGDFFGPLVVVAARVEQSQLPLLAELGVGDSKKITDKKILKMAEELRHVVPHKKLILMPAKYNELYSRIGNLNQLLAWAHATSAEDLLEHGVQAELILSDQFSKRDIISSRLKERGKQLRFTQRTKAEEDPAVGCASIFARAEFLYRMRELEKTVGMDLPKGAGPPVLAAGRRFVSERGFADLAGVAKVHFKTTKQLG